MSQKPSLMVPHCLSVIVRITCPHGRCRGHDRRI